MVTPKTILSMRYLISHLICWCWNGEEVLISDVKNNLYKLSESAAFIWSLFREPNTIEAAIELVATKFDVNQTVAKNDVECLIEALLSRGFLLEDRPSRAYSP